MSKYIPKPYQRIPLEESRTEAKRVPAQVPGFFPQFPSEIPQMNDFWPPSGPNNTFPPISGHHNGQIRPDDMAPEPETLQNSLFVPGYLETQIGKLMRVEFLIGTTIDDRSGILEKVGASYIILRPLQGYSIMCDLFSIKFVSILDRPSQPILKF